MNRTKVSVTRRGFLKRTGAAGLAAALPEGLSARPLPPPTGGDTFLDLLRPPNSVTAYTGPGTAVPLAHSTSGWSGKGISVSTKVDAATLSIAMTAPGVALERVHLRWRMPVAADLLVFGDAWERSYGDLSWRGLVPERVLPWYFAAAAPGGTVHSYGVKTGAGALCFWQVDRDGVSLWLDTRNGGSGVLLDEEQLLAATIVARRGEAGENVTEALRAFCRQMCSRPTPLTHCVYGFNDWYYAYGRNTAAQILADTELLQTLSVGNPARPFCVIDDGWEDGSRFPSMAKLAEQIKARDVRPGLWIRPTLAAAGTPAKLLLPDARFGAHRERAREQAYDLTIPEAREAALRKVKQVTAWRYELVKHDFSTYDLLGQWGFEMGASPTLPGWSFNDRSVTNAQVISDWYRAIRKACAPETVVLGCNTIGHLGQGWFDIQRTGDDTSGKVWERTRRMGVNTLAYRLPQDRAFFVQDADCVGITADVPWEQNRQWLDVLARSGTAVFVSPGEGARGAEQVAGMRAAFAMAAAGGSGAVPDGLLPDRTVPDSWIEPGGHVHTYDWSGPEGAWPFAV
jgi:alpha-galactosidase